MSRRSRTAVAVAGGIMAGLVVAVVLIVAVGLGDRATPKPKPEATGEFLDAFQRSIGATFVAKADFTRVLDNGRTLQSATFTAQRPPDRIQRQFGGISGTVAGSQIMCSTTLDGQFHCGPAAPAADPAASAASQMDNLRSYFADPVLYRVVKGDPGCFELTQVRPLPLAPYGSAATMCFDQVTGAMSYLQQHLEGAVDTYATYEIRGFATDEDFSLAQDNTYDSTSGGERADLGVPPSDTSVSTSSSVPGPPGSDTTTTGG